MTTKYKNLTTKFQDVTKGKFTLEKVTTEKFKDDKQNEVQFKKAYVKYDHQLDDGTFETSWADFSLAKMKLIFAKQDTVAKYKVGGYAVFEPETHLCNRCRLFSIMKPDEFDSAKECDKCISERREIWECIKDPSFTEKEGWIHHNRQSPEKSKVSLETDDFTGKRSFRTKKKVKIYSKPPKEDSEGNIEKDDSSEYVSVEGGETLDLAVMDAQDEFQQQCIERGWYKVKYGAEQGFQTRLRRMLAKLLNTKKARQEIGANILNDCKTEDDVFNLLKPIFKLSKNGMYTYSPKFQYFPYVAPEDNKKKPGEERKESLARLYDPIKKGVLSLQELKSNSYILQPTVRLLDIYIGGERIVPKFIITSGIVHMKLPKENPSAYGANSAIDKEYEGEFDEDALALLRQQREMLDKQTSASNPDEGGVPAQSVPQGGLGDDILRVSTQITSSSQSDTDAVADAVASIKPFENPEDGDMDDD